MKKVKLTTFYIVRHGETDWNIDGRMQGHADIALNEKGHLQAAALGKELQSVHFDKAFSSDLIRAHRTAEIIALEKKLAVETTKLLRERSFGKYEGEPKATYLSIRKFLTTLTDEQRRTHKYDNEFESDDEMLARWITFIREVAVAYPGKTILAVAHGGMIRVLLQHLGLSDYKRFAEIKNTAYIKMRTDGSDFFVDELNGITIPEATEPS